jgi:dihydrofolate reductase
MMVGLNRFGQNRVRAKEALVVSRRTLAAAVKELSWCSPSDSPNRTKARRTNNAQNDTNALLVPIDQFAVVAAMSKHDRIIGVNGKLPWSIPEDRRLFEELTTNKLLVIGRKTLLEDENLAHVSHVAHCIVISKSWNEPQLLSHATALATKTKLVVADSFPSALALARKIANDNMQTEQGKNDCNENGYRDESLKCWVAGGEQIFNEAVMHPSCRRIYLSVIDIELDISSTTTSVARFPPKYRWDNNFKEDFGSRTVVTTSSTPFTHHVFHRTSPDPLLTHSDF